MANYCVVCQNDNCTKKECEEYLLKIQELSSKIQKTHIPNISKIQVDNQEELEFLDNMFESVSFELEFSKMKYPLDLIILIEEECYDIIFKTTSIYEREDFLSKF